MRQAIRRVLRSLTYAALAVFVCGQAGVAVSAITLPVDARADAECHCPAGMDHGSCPMHHSKAGRQRCLMRGTQAPTDASLLALVVAVGPPAGPRFLKPATPSVRVATAGTSAIDRRLAPDSPPPRS